MRSKAVSALRILSTDMINNVNSGHPGIALGAAPIMEALYSEFLTVNNENTDWINRDRFVLSAGHGAPLLYSMLHFTKFGLTVEDLKQLRKLNSLTPGHPESDVTKGVDVSTGPLGQGVATAVGLAVAENYLRNKFNKDKFNIIDHYTYTLVGDGDLQEGIAQEALSFCGTNKLDKLIVLYDSNDIQLDGPTSLCIEEDVESKYKAMGFNYILVKDGNNSEEVINAITKAKSQSDKPSFIEIKTIIGFGTKVANNCESHGSPIGNDNSNMLRQLCSWNNEPFIIDEDVYDYFDKKVVQRGKESYSKWNDMINDYKDKYPKDYEMLMSACSDEYISNLNIQYDLSFSEASRITGGKILDKLSNEFPTLIGGSADLSKSTKVKGADGNFSKTSIGRNINFGVREHAMAAIVNGITIHTGVRGFCGGFFVFSDYMKPAIRMAALMHIPSLFIFTHDSIAVGEDGPTHEPIEQLIALRSIPNLNVIRPGDANEVLEAYKIALKSRTTPTVIVLTRQNLIVNSKTPDVEKGAYIIKKEKGALKRILLTTGSEVDLCCKVAEQLDGTRVVSMPSTYLFEKQSKEYQKEILSNKSLTIAVEMGATIGWYKYADNVIGIDKFGASANEKVLLDEYGFTVDKIINKIKGL